MSDASIEDLGNIRLEIIKSMLAEFPDLRIKITKEILIEGINSSEGQFPLKDYLTNIANESRTYYHQSSKEIYRQSNKRKQTRDSVPLWAKFSMATVKQDSDGRYYFFK